MFGRSPPPSVCLGNHSLSAYHLCGLVGWIATLVTTVALARMMSLSVGLLATLWAVSVLVFLGLAMATKWVNGEETLVYYRHEVAVLATAATIVWLAGKPLLPYLDVTVIAMGTFLIFGRIGCYAVGCCHGKPSTWGVRYRQAHAEQGFPGYLVGVRLVPTQLIEAGGVACVVLVAWVLLARQSVHGTALVWYTLIYGALRFVLEFFRGDAARPQFFGYSEAQWWSVVLGGGALLGICFGHLPPVLTPRTACAAVIGVCAVPLLLHRWTNSLARRLVTPCHVAELANAINPDAATMDWVGKQTSDPVLLPPTSLGLRISYALHSTAHGSLHQYSLSLVTGQLGGAGAQSLAMLISQLRYSGIPHQLVTGNAGVVHVLIPEADASET